MWDARANHTTDTIYFKDFFNFADQMHAMGTYEREDVYSKQILRLADSGLF
ncbi:hypothetical protein SAMN03159391_02884 [Pseudomonas sp. NFACC37-1]|nr:hypothetical protein SAMN03159391_02884 [Pseudomonas sp. NFACC37-1]